MHITATQCLKALPDNLDRALVYGDGLFETIAVFDGAPPLWCYHKSRLSVSLNRLGIPADIAVIEETVLSIAAQAGSGLLRLFVTRGGGQRGYDPRTARSCTMTVELFPLPSYPDAIVKSGISLHLCKHVLPRNPALAGLKHTNRLDHVLASAEWDRQWEREGLLLDDTGAVIEGTISNVFIVRSGILQTPGLDSCGVAGVMRAWILDTVAERLSLQVEIRRLTLADVLAADECFVCNSVFGVWSVRKIGVAFLEKRSSITEDILEQVWLKGYGRLYA